MSTLKYHLSLSVGQMVRELNRINWVMRREFFQSLMPPGRLIFLNPRLLQKLT